MIESVLFLIISIHWAFSLGIFLAMRTQFKTYQVCFFVVALKIFLMSYGVK